MAASSIASQLQAIKSLVKANTEPLKRPFTRPSILFDPKEAADIDIDTLFSIAISGLEDLSNVDERFQHFRNDLFSQKSREVDRELMGVEDNHRIDASINCYLRLLSGHLHLRSAFNTLEYLIRRYKVHVYNTEELILSAIPYHDTHAFVRIMQLIDLGNSRWKFLDGVKESGAPLPRNIIVRQCMTDIGVLEALCNYATPVKKYQPSVPVIGFCTAVVIEVLGYATTIDNAVVQRILPFVVSALQSGRKGSPEYKAGALMVIALLANKVTLSPKLVKSLVQSIAEMARADARESADLKWFQISVTALITIVQLQSVEALPRKVVDVLKEIRDLPGILSMLSKKFNIDRFLIVLWQSLVDYSNIDNLCKDRLVAIAEAVPVSSVVQPLVSRLLSSCLRLSVTRNASELPESGSWAKEVLVVFHKKHPQELRRAFHKFLQDVKVQFKGDTLVLETLCKMLDGTSDTSFQIPDSKIWFALEHPKAEIRRGTLHSLEISALLKDNSVNSKRLISIQDTILRCLEDDDLSVVEAALSLDGLSELVNPQDLFQAFQNLLTRCTGILFSDVSNDSVLAGDVAVLCLQCAVSCFKNKSDFQEGLASLIFPLLLILPKAKLLNMKALECAKETKWPLYRNIAATNCLEKKPGKEWYSSVNATTVSSLGDVFSSDVLEYLPLLAKFCNSSELSKTLSLFVILQSSMMETTAVTTIFEACFAFLKAEWQSLNLTEDALSGEEITSEFSLLYELTDTTDLKKFNARILVCAFWWLVKAHVQTKPALLDDSGDWMRTLQELYVFFAECNMKHVFKEHRHYIVLALNSPVHFLLKFVNEGTSYGVQVESLRSLTLLCSTSDEGLGLQLLAEFPSVLASLFNEIKDVRVEAMNYLEELSSLWSRVSSTAKRNGNMESWFSVTEDLLNILVRQKKLILSDKNFLQSLLSSVLSSSFQSLLAPEFLELRFDRSNAEEILGFILGRALKYPSYAKMKILSLLKEVGDAVMQNKNVQSLLHELLRQRNDYLFRHDKSCPKLSSMDVEILCLLVEMCFMAAASDVHCFEDPLLMVLRIDDVCLDEPAVSQPCITLLKKLNNCFFGSMKTEKQECLLQELVLLYQHPNSDVQDAAREAVMRLTITSLTLSNLLDAAVNCEVSRFKRRKSVKESHSMIPSGENVFCFLSSLLDIMVLKKDIHDRVHLVNPLFQLLGKILSKKLTNVIITEDMVRSATGISQSMSNAMCYIQQTILLILEDIIASFSSASDISLKGGKLDESEIALLVECARDASTHSHTFSVFAAISKIMPNKVLDFIPDMLAIVCRSTDSQTGYSKHIFEDFISAIVPCWLSNKNEAVTLLQILVNVMPEVAQYQRLSITMEFLRTIGECTGLGLLLLLLFRSLALRQGSITAENKLLSPGPLVSGAAIGWEYMFAAQICEQYACMIWLPSLVVLLHQQLRTGNHSQELFVELLLAMQFISDKLQNPELLFELRLGGDINTIQETLADLMEQVVCSLHLVDLLRKEIKATVTIKKGLKELIHNVFNFISKGMAPSSFFKGIVRLLCHAEKSVRKKALQLLCETMKYLGTEKSRKERKSYMQLIISWDNLDDSAWASFDALSRKILQLVDESLDDQDVSVKLIGFSALEILANKFSSDHTIFAKCLASIVKHALSEDLAVSSACLRTTGALIKVLGTRALSELPQIMKCLLERSKSMCLPFHVTVKDANKKSPQSIVGESVMASYLVTLEAVVEKLGPFLSPYLDEILEVLVLHPDYISQSGQNLKAKADSIRRLLSEKVPVRLALPPLLKIYSKAINSGDTSLSITFEMIAKFVGTMDKSSISTFHAKIFDMSLLALDLRRQSLPSVKNIAVVEKHVIDALIVLTLKLTETTFKPLFIRAIEWAESSVDQDECGGVTNINRAISFYSLVNRLAESHRSLFVPYFKYFLESCLQYLTDNKTQGAGSRKKAKHDGMDRCKFISVEMWHLRSLVISALHKCFLFDIGTCKFLDSSNFQVLLKPIVSQLGLEPPASVKDYPDIPSTEEVDNLLVSCIGQMAVTSGSDLLWKPLNYEVLMQTRSELVRSRMLGLRIVKNLIQNLKEEYLVLLAETIPFLAELLEDVELPIKSLAQEILKELETMSGEDLRQCF